MRRINKTKVIKFILWIFSIVISGLVLLAGIHIFRKFGADPDAWAEYLRSFGVFSGVALLAFQVLQVFVAFIPGELVEIVSGLIFHPVIACAICYVGIFLASALIFFLMRKLGKRFSKIFVSGEKLRSLRFINTKDKLKKTVFLLFLIPGTPKDLLTYFFALAPIKYFDFFVITAFARIPSVISSVLGGRLVGEEEYGKAIVLFVITAAVSVAGLVSYDALRKKLEKRRKERVNAKVRFRLMFQKKKEKSRILKIKSFIIRNKIKAHNLKIKKTKSGSVLRPTKLFNASKKYI